MNAIANWRDTTAPFNELVAGASPDSWDNPSPVAEWNARDIVRHLIEWLPGFLRGGGIDFPETHAPSVDEDPVAAWNAHANAVESILEAAEGKIFAHPRLPEMPLDAAISQFYTADVFQHTWDLARATDQPAELDPERCKAMYEGMLPMDDILRASGQYGPKVDVPDDATYQDKLIGFIGRDPNWRG